MSSSTNAEIVRKCRALLVEWDTQATGEECQCAKCGEFVSVPSDYEWSDGDMCHACWQVFGHEAMELLTLLGWATVKDGILKCKACKKPLTASSLSGSEGFPCECGGGA